MAPDTLVQSYPVNTDGPGLKRTNLMTRLKTEANPAEPSPWISESCCS